ncbi:MAG TPA: PLP-dependent transferase, partial [Sphingobacterium sp.]|nr:PLP-dependent transferase [Sphingobacterium sp.]
GSTGMLCIEVEGADDQKQFANAQILLNSLRVFSNAVSLGGVESLIAHPASMWGANYTEEQRRKSGITNGLLRISVGIEHIDDLIADFEQAIACI